MKKYILKQIQSIIHKNIKKYYNETIGGSKMEDIKKGMNKIFNVSIATSVIILVLGIFLFIQPDTIIHMISIVLGGIILVSGIIALIDYFGSKYNPSLISGVITSIIGLILIINTKLVASILPFVLGIYFTINGINRLQYSLELKKEKMNYLSSFIVSILIIVCGVLFIINPFGGALVITKVMGIFMIVYALLDLTNTIIIKKEMHDVKQKMKDAIIEVDIDE